MNEQIQKISARIKELREILDYTAEEIAEKLGIDLGLYNDYEAAREDIPIGVLYSVAGLLGVDPTELLTGEAPRMADYTIVRGGNGVSVERCEGYKFSSLAFNYIGREMAPMIVTLEPGPEQPELITHGGQEFNYVLDGPLMVVIGDRSFVLDTGDSIYFNPAKPHGQRAIDKTVKFLTVINEKLD